MCIIEAYEFTHMRIMYLRLVLKDDKIPQSLGFDKAINNCSLVFTLDCS